MDRGRGGVGGQQIWIKNPYCEYHYLWPMWIRGGGKTLIQKMWIVCRFWRNTYICQIVWERQSLRSFYQIPDPSIEEQYVWWIETKRISTKDSPPLSSPPTVTFPSGHISSASSPNILHVIPFLKYQYPARFSLCYIYSMKFSFFPYLVFSICIFNI